MYLNHHYAVDLVGGSLISTSIYYIARTRYLPQQQPEKKNRWQYEFVEIGEKPRSLDEEYGYIGKSEGYSLGLLGGRSSEDADEWTIGSSSSFSVGSSPRTSMATSPTIMSPTTPESLEFQHVSIPMNLDGQLEWDNGERGPARESEVSEVVVMR